MSILDTDVIDIIATRPDTRVVKLMIADHLSWDDLEVHTSLLQDKINTYLRFLEEGQFHSTEVPNIPDNPEFHIVLVIQQQPSREAHEIFARIRQALENLGLVFEVDVRASAEEH